MSKNNNNNVQRKDGLSAVSIASKKGHIEVVKVCVCVCVRARLCLLCWGVVRWGDGDGGACVWGVLERARACVRACVRAYVRACVRACLCERACVRACVHL